ncbi:hypothetical protein WJX84_007545 [Apatococcus fuscideae]|uniref:Uncharacterized protein n=1 Tax=Apatococcus fuscideae TaxID=2026836 RepID=A0AAW1SQJ9_9CHLO
MPDQPVPLAPAVMLQPSAHQQPASYPYLHARDELPAASPFGHRPLNHWHDRAQHYGDDRAQQHVASADILQGQPDRDRPYRTVSPVPQKPQPQQHPQRERGPSHPTSSGDRSGTDKQHPWGSMRPAGSAGSYPHHIAFADQNSDQPGFHGPQGFHHGPQMRSPGSLPGPSDREPGPAAEHQDAAGRPHRYARRAGDDERDASGEMLGRGSSRYGAEAPRGMRDAQGDGAISQHPHAGPQYPGLAWDQPENVPRGRPPSPGSLAFSTERHQQQQQFMHREGGHRGSQWGRSQPSQPVRDHMNHDRSANPQELWPSYPFQGPGEPGQPSRHARRISWDSPQQQQQQPQWLVARGDMQQAASRRQLEGRYSRGGVELPVGYGRYQSHRLSFDEWGGSERPQPHSDFMRAYDESRTARDVEQQWQPRPQTTANFPFREQADEDWHLSRDGSSRQPLESRAVRLQHHTRPL